MADGVENWRRLERLEQRRRKAHKEHEEAMRELQLVATGDGASDQALERWRAYCEAAAVLEAVTSELQQLRMTYAT